MHEKKITVNCTQGAATENSLLQNIPRMILRLLYPGKKKIKVQKGTKSIKKVLGANTKPMVHYDSLKPILG